MTARYLTNSPALASLRTTAPNTSGACSLPQHGQIFYLPHKHNIHGIKGRRATVNMWHAFAVSGILLQMNTGV